MNEQLQSFVDSRDDALVAYGLTGEAVDKARYQKAVKVLREYIDQYDIDMEEYEIDTLHFENMKVHRIPPQKYQYSADDEYDDEDYDYDYEYQ